MIWNRIEYDWNELITTRGINILKEYASTSRLYNIILIGKYFLINFFFLFSLLFSSNKRTSQYFFVIFFFFSFFCFFLSSSLVMFCLLSSRFILRYRNISYISNNIANVFGRSFTIKRKPSVEVTDPNGFAYRRNNIFLSNVSKHIHFVNILRNRYNGR